MPTLSWTGKDAAIVAVRDVPYRPLVEVPHLGYGDADAGNLLIQGDNLDALKALLPVYAGRVKCIFIDPPYNTRSAFEHYDDNREHSIWLSLMYPRLELLRELLAEDGSIWVTIDDNEGHYLKVVMDEIFGRANFISEIAWQKRTSRENRAAIGSAHDVLLVYAKRPAVRWKDGRNLLPPNTLGFSNPDNDPRGPWRSIPFSAQGFRANQMYPIVSPSGIRHQPPKGRCWAALESEFKKYEAENRVYFPKDGAGKPRIKLFKGEENGLVPMSVWLAAEAGDTEESKREILALFDEDSPFGTPKPERLIERVIRIACNAGDLVLDSFLGSGTTAAVAHKMGRRWIGIELGEHAETHCAARLRKVIDGEQGGISEFVGWQGGGGFRFCRLGAPVFDGRGSIRPGVGFADLARWIWYRETRQPLAGVPASPLLGVHRDTAYYLLFNGILGDRRPDGGNVLTAPVLAALPSHTGPRVVFGEACRLHESTLAAQGLRFRQLPYQANA